LRHSVVPNCRMRSRLSVELPPDSQKSREVPLCRFFGLGEKLGPATQAIQNAAIRKIALALVVAAVMFVGSRTWVSDEQE
jgi:hypothetical protein